MLAIALSLQIILACAGPVALIHGRCDIEKSQLQLLQLSSDLRTCGNLLVLPSNLIDMVLLPRAAAVTG